MMTEAERLLRRLTEQAFPIPESGCLLWMGDLNEDGYGVSSTPLLTTRLVHRQVVELKNGRLPKSLSVDHKCRVRCCIREDHLEVTSVRENSKRVHRRR